MTNQDKKSYLSQYQLLNRKIDRLLEEKARWWSLATKVTANSSGMPSGSTETDSRQAAITAMISIEQEIDKEIDALIDLRSEMKQVVLSVPDARLVELLEWKYINGLTFEAIAEKMGITDRWAKELHGHALTLLETLPCSSP